jgi:hypothetical protein
MRATKEQIQRHNHETKKTCFRRVKEDPPTSWSLDLSKVLLQHFAFMSAIAEPAAAEAPLLSFSVAFFHLLLMCVPLSMRSPGQWLFCTSSAVFAHFLDAPRPTSIFHTRLLLFFGSQAHDTSQLFRRDY